MNQPKNQAPGPYKSGVATVPVSFKFAGEATRILSSIGGDFEKTLAKALSHASLGGVFTLIPLTKVRGRPHTRGLTIGSPNGRHHCVEVCWQKGGNDTRFNFNLCAPHGMSPMEFHSRLLRGYERFLEEEESPPTLPPVEVGEHMHGKNKVTTLSLPTSSSPQVSQKEPEAAQANVIHLKDDFAHAFERANEHGAFVGDEILVALFIDECLKSVTNKGTVLRSVCRSVLKESFQYSDTESVCAALVKAGHLLVVAGKPDYYQIPPQHMPTSASNPSTSDVEATIAAQTTAASTPEKGGVEPAEVKARISQSLTSQVARLTKDAKTAATLRLRIQEVETELASLEALRDQALARKARFEAGLNRPEIKDAEKNLLELETLLKKFS